MKLATWHWHIEISSKCTLACPRCPRQEHPDSLVQTELKLDFFKRNFTPNFIREHVEKITLCGDDGDPIYARELIDVIQYFKSIKPVKFVIVTNGSYQKPQWWTRLGHTLTDIDHVHVSLDGWDQHSNEQYRINSHWDSIMAGVQRLRRISNVYLTWDMIVFKFNEHKIDHMQSLAKQHGFDEIQITRSTKFGANYDTYPNDDPLQPSDDNVAKGARFIRDIRNISGRMVSDVGLDTNLKLYNTVPTFGDIKPMCYIGNKGLYINARGLLFPCCWVANRYGHNMEWQQLAQNFDLKKRTLLEVLQDPFWQTTFKNFHWSECKTKCNMQVVNQDYGTQW